MRSKAAVSLVCVVALLCAAIKIVALPNPINKPPSFLKFNSVTVKGVSKAQAGQALVADGNAGSKMG